MAQEINGCAQGLGALLSETEMKAMVLAAPQKARLWVPLMNALLIDKPAWWPKAPTRARKPRPWMKKPLMTGLELAAEAIRLSQPQPPPSPPEPTGPPPGTEYSAPSIQTGQPWWFEYWCRTTRSGATTRRWLRGRNCRRTTGRSVSTN